MSLRPRSPGAWRLEGSSNGAAWDLIDERAGVTWTGHTFTTPKLYAAQGALPVGPLILSDTFTDTNGTLPTAHVPDTDTTGVGYTASAGQEIRSNAVYVTTGAASYVEYDPGTPNAEIRVRFKLPEPVGVSAYVEIVAPYVSAGSQMAVRLTQSGGLSIRENGSTARASVQVGTVTRQVWHTLRVRREGPALTAWLDETAAIHYAGASANAAVSLIRVSTNGSSGIELDDFSVLDLTGI